MPDLKTVHDLFRAQAQRTPEALALVDGPRRWTYAELDRESDRLAAWMRSQGVGRDQTVGIMLPTSGEYVLGCMAALKAGGAYLPLDLAHPGEHLLAILDQTKSPVVLTRSNYRGKLKGWDQGVLACLDVGVELPENPGDLPEVQAGDLAYVVFTSGTTGEPKGIAAPHRGSVHSYGERHRFQAYAPGQRVACNIFFTWEFFRPLARGAAVFVIRDEVIQDPRALAEFLEAHQITEMLFTPSLLEATLQALGDARAREAFASLEVVYLNGEVVTERLRSWALGVLPESTRFVNTYSISECHDVSNLDLRQDTPRPSGFCPVGYPIDGVEVRIVDPEMKPVAVGQKGELLVGGPGLARGYLNRPDLTEARFLEIEGTRFYRTGDVAVSDSMGLLEIQGRCDFMVKIRGYSVPLPAVEAALRKLDSVSAAAVIAEGEEGTDKRLVAYVTAAAGRSLEVDPKTGLSPSLGKALEAHLADFMTPRVFVVVDTLPVDAVSGKLDLKSLPPPPPRPRVKHRVSVLAPDAPESVRRKTLAEVFASVLGISPETLNESSDFFELGGHSLLGVELASELERVFGRRISVQSIYQRSRLDGLSDLLSGRDEGGESSPESSGAWIELAQRDSRLSPDFENFEAFEPFAWRDDQEVFLTGATGFLGAFLLHEILSQTPARVLCLVRGEDRARAKARLKRVLLGFGLNPPDFASRVEAIPGDLSKDRFGLEEAAFGRLSRRIEAVFHCGALVNYVLPYEKLRGASVGGTREVLRLIAEGEGARLLHVSSSGIVPEGAGLEVRECEAIESYAPELTGGYGRAKWVAERLVWRAVEKGLDAVVFRPGNLGHHRDSGVANPRDLQYRVFAAGQRLGALPVEESWVFEATPVNELAAAMVALAADPEAGGQVFHPVSASPPRLKDLAQAFERRAGLELLSWQAWQSRLREQVREKGDPEDAVLLETLVEIDQVWSAGNRFLRPGFDAALAKHKIPTGAVDAAYFESYLENPGR